MSFRRHLLHGSAGAVLGILFSGPLAAGPVGMNDGPPAAMREASGVDGDAAFRADDSGRGLSSDPGRGAPGAGAPRPTAADGIDFGEAGRMVRLLEDAERNRAGRVTPGRPESRAARPLPLDALAPESGERPSRAPAAGRAALPSDAETIDAGSAEAERPRLQRQGAAGGDDAEAVRVLAEMASPEQRNFVVDTVRYLKSVMAHPLTWAVLGVLGVLGLMLSTAGRRKR